MIPQDDASDTDIFRPPPNSPLERIEWDDQSRRRRRSAFFFWFSFAVLAVTTVGAILPLLDISTRGGGGRNFASLGQFVQLWLAAVVGLTVAIASCVVAVVTSKRGANLLMTEVALMILLLFWMFRPAP